MDDDYQFDDNLMGQKKSRGRGWFGNSEAHAKVGRKGGLARKSKRNSRVPR